MPRVLRIAASLAIVLVVYGAYALLAVPLIEPAADVRQGEEITDAQRAKGSGLVDARMRIWKNHFAPDAWELDGPKMLESDRITLLMRDYRNLGNGQMELRPCTIILTPKGPPGNLAQRRHQAVILQVPEGALLTFDGPLDLGRAKIGRLVSGILKGPIKIRSKGKKPGPEDDFLITLRDAELTEHDVRTPHAVDFRFGPNHGRGRGLYLKLADTKRTELAGKPKTGVMGIELFELKHIERLHLALDTAELASTTKAGSARQAGAAKQPAPAKGDRDADASLPVEITCRGPFRFDNIKKVATFEDHVDLWRINPTGQSDHLSCELLSIFFVEQPRGDPVSPGNTSPGNTSPGNTSPGNTDMKAQRIEARGNPVDIFMPSEQPPIHARGQRLEYNLQTKRIVLDGAGEVMLKQGPNEIHARSLQYLLAEPGRMGRIIAAGPGWLRGEMAEREGEQFEARWNKQLQVRPHEKNQVISLTGGARLNFSEIGQLEAGEIHFWLLELPAKKPKDRLQLQPDRLLASDNVRINSPELFGAFEQLEMWFEHTAAGPPVRQRMADKGHRSTALSGRRPRVGLVPTAFRREKGNTALFRPLARVVNTVLVPMAGRPQPPPARQRHFRISGRLLQARVLVRQNRQTELSELMVQDNVHFVETQTAEPNEQPMVVTGDRMHVVDADTLYATVTILGRPARFEARGLTLIGSNINLNRGTNRLWIDGPGEMHVPMDRDLDGKPMQNPGTLAVHWQDRMFFDGRTARFEESVSAAAPLRQLWTDTLEVQFREPVRFSDTKIKQKPEVEQILCRGSVTMQYVTMEGQDFKDGQQTSYQRMQVADLAINRTSGALTAGGPGYVATVRRGSDDLLAGPAAAAGHNAPAAEADPDQLQGLHVRFQGSITGNVHRRIMTFHDRVRTTFAPVDSWTTMLDTDDPDVLGPGGVVMHCDHLTVNEMTTPAGTHRELAADGNVRAEGNREDGNFIARAISMTYTEAKNMLVFKGDGRTYAELFRQQRIGGPTSRVAARKIFYWPQSDRVGRLIFENAQGLDSSGFSAEKTGNK